MIKEALKKSEKLRLVKVDLKVRRSNRSTWNCLTKSKKRAIIFRLIVIVVIPFILGALIFPHTETLRPVELTVTDYINRNQTITQQMSTFTKVDGSPLDMQSIQNNLTESPISQLDSTFPLVNYLNVWPLVRTNIDNICLNNSGSYIVYPDGANTTGIYYKIKTKENEITLKPGEEICFPTNEPFPGFEPIYIIELNHMKIGENITKDVNIYADTVLKGIPNRDYGILLGIASIGGVILFLGFISETKKRIYNGFID